MSASEFGGGEDDDDMSSLSSGSDISDADKDPDIGCWNDPTMSVSCVKCHFSTIVPIIMRQFEDRCHNSIY